MHEATLDQELTLLCQEQPEGIASLLTALEQGQVNGASITSCAYFYMAGCNVKRALPILQAIEHRLHTEGCTPLEKAVINVREGDDLLHPGVRNLSRQIRSIRDNRGIASVSVVPGLYEKGQEQEGEQQS